MSGLGAFVLAFLFFVCLGAHSAQPQPVSDAAAQALERLSFGSLRVITAFPGESEDRAVVRAYEKTGNLWMLRFETTGFFGRSGVLADRWEGSGATPSGNYTFGMAFGIADDPGSLLPYTKVTENDVWVDDPESEHYNRWASKDAPDADWISAEHLIEQVVEYQYVLSINYNTDPVVKGRGSAIFLHSSAGKPTAGCISVPDEAMIFFLAFVDEKTRIVIGESRLY